MATAAGSSVESEALRLAFSYLVNSINVTSVLPAAWSAHLISDVQKRDCDSETAPFKRAVKFLGHLQRAVDGDSNKYHTFVQVLKETGQAIIASRLQDQLTKASRLMPPSQEQQIVVPDKLLEDLAALRVDYASLLCEYKNVLDSSPEAQRKLVETLPGLLGRSLGPDHSFQSYFNKLVDEKVSLFNINYLKQLCHIFPADVRTSTKKLVDQYNQQLRDFMASKTVKQFKALFPASATPSKLLAEKFTVELMVLKSWDARKIDDLMGLAHLFGVSKLNLTRSGDKYTLTVSASATSTTEQEADPGPPLDADTAHEAIEQEVDLSVSNLVISGSPGSGKTCTLYLSVNEPAPTVRHSTGCVEKPVRAIAHAAICISGTKLQKLETKEMLRMACQTIKHKIQEIRRRKRAEAQRRHEARTPDSSTSTGKQRIRKPSNVDSPLEPPTPSSASTSQGEEKDEEEDEKDEEENIQVFAKLLDEISAVEASTDFLTARLVSTVDTGGQPHFMDAARLFLRNNSLYLLTIKLNEPLDAKPKFDYYIDGIPITMCNTDLQLTNLQLVESLAMNVASLQLTTPNTAEAGSEPQQAKFMIVGTFADCAGECQNETIADKNKRLRERLKDFKAERVDVDGKVIFAINAITTDPDERQKTALKLQKKIIETPGITIETKVKLRWFGLLLHMLDEAEKRKASVLHLDEVIAAGKCLKMSEEETMEAIKYFHDLNLIMHYRTTKLEHIVFVDMKPPLDKVSSLIGVSFINQSILDELFKPNLPTDDQESLRDYGRFTQDILKSFSFSKPFTAEIFLDLLEHLCIIARIRKSGKTAFFLPCALPYAPDDLLKEKEQAYRNPWILRLKMRRNIASVDVPTPKGYLPTLIVSLLNSPEFETDDSSRQYRNLISIRYRHTRGGQVYFIEKNCQLEIYYSWENEYYQHCSVIRSKILEVLVEVEKKLQFQPDILVKEDVFVCSCNGPDPRHFCTYVSQIEKVVCEKTQKPLKLTHQQKHWFDDQAAEAQHMSSKQSSGGGATVAQPGTSQVSASAGSGDRILEIKDLKDVDEYVCDLNMTQFKKLGLQLGLLQPTLDKLTDGTKPEDYGTKVMTEWLNQVDSARPTWNNLAKALDKRTVKAHVQAAQIREDLKNRTLN